MKLGVFWSIVESSGVGCGNGDRLDEDALDEDALRWGACAGSGKRMSGSCGNIFLRLR